MYTDSVHADYLTALNDSSRRRELLLGDWATPSIGARPARTRERDDEWGEEESGRAKSTLY